MTTLTRGSTRWRSPGAAATSSEKIARRTRFAAAAQRLRDVSTLAALPDASARAQPDLAARSQSGASAARDRSRSYFADVSRLAVARCGPPPRRRRWPRLTTTVAGDQQRSRRPPRRSSRRWDATRPEVVAGEERVGPEVAVLPQARSAPRCSPYCLRSRSAGLSSPNAPRSRAARVARARPSTPSPMRIPRTRGLRSTGVRLVVGLGNRRVVDAQHRHVRPLEVGDHARGQDEARRRRRREVRAEHRRDRLPRWNGAYSGMCAPLADVL